MRQSIRKAISVMLIIVTVITLTPASIYAENEWDKPANKGDASGGSSYTGGGRTWLLNQSGYRLTIANQEFKPVSNTVDLVFSEPIPLLSNKNDMCSKSRAGEGSGPLEIVPIAEMLNDPEFEGGQYPPYPISTEKVNGQEVFVANGAEFKKWFLGDKNTNIGREGKPGTGGSSSGGSGGSSSGGSSGSGGSKSPAPIAGSIDTSKDMNRVSLAVVRSNTTIRTINRNSALVKALSMGASKEYMDKLATKFASDIIREFTNYERVTKTSISKSYKDNTIACYYGKIDDYFWSNSEAIYTGCQMIDRVLAAFPDNRAGGGSGGGDTGPVDGSGDFRGIMYERFELDGIPLSNATNDETRNVVRVLNYTDTQGYVFKLDGVTPSSGKLVSDVVIENEYVVIVEPLFWYVPANADSNGIIPPVYSNYVYGTVGNFAEFYNNNSSILGDTKGGAYKTAFGSLGWQCMHTGENWAGDGVTIKGVTNPSGEKTTSQLRSMINDNYGVAMHLYTAEDLVNNQTTKDPGINDRPHAAPDPKDLVDSATREKKHVIVKYYEKILEDGSREFIDKFVTEENPHTIYINTEPNYSLEDWFISYGSDTWSDDYRESKSAGYSRTGTTPQLAELEETELTLHLLLVESRATGGGHNAGSQGPLDLTESRISMSISTMNTSIPGWGPREFKFNYSDMVGSHRVVIRYEKDKDGKEQPVYDTCRAVFGDNAYKYIIENNHNVDSLLEANSAGGVFASKMVNNTKSGTASISGGSDSINTAEYQTVIWRGRDIPTIAGYKEHSGVEIRSLLGRYGTKPAGSRAGNGQYTRQLIIQLGVSNESDLSNHSVHNLCGGIYKETTHRWANVSSHSAEVTVHVYAGSNNKSPGRETVASQILTTTPFGGVDSLNSAGFMIPGSHPIQFYPYIRMTYQTTGSTEKKDVHVLSQFYSEVQLNSFAEASWNHPNEKNSLTMTSNQWSLHAKAISGQSWSGRNQVLPGGALFYLGTTNKSEVALVTWQPIVQDKERSMLYNTLPSSVYTLATAQQHHKNFVSDAKDVIEGLRIVQWVNSDVDARNAWDGPNSVKVKDGGESLSALGLSGTADKASKYRFGEGTSKDAANEGDLDVINQRDNPTMFYKVFSSPDGCIWLARSGDLSSLSDINGTNKSGNGNVTISKVLNKEQGPESLTGEAKELDKRTLVITNLTKALERNSGHDPSASWAGENGCWYNESFDGVVVARQATYLTVGLGVPEVRSTVLDPKLCPPNYGVSDLFSSAFVSQFRCDSKSDAAKDKVEGYIGTFQGREVTLPEMQNLYSSKKFYIPNVNVQDL